MGEQLMDRGKWVIMFPEGTRSERGQQGIYKTGAARLAMATGASIVPIAVASARCWPRKSFTFVPGTIQVSLGEPIVPDPAGSPGEMMEKVEAWIEEEMRRIDPEAYPEGERPSDLAQQEAAIQASLELRADAARGSHGAAENAKE